MVSPLALEDAENLGASDAADLGDAVAVTQHNANLGGGRSLPGQLANLREAESIVRKSMKQKSPRRQKQANTPHPSLSYLVDDLSAGGLAPRGRRTLVGQS